MRSIDAASLHYAKRVLIKGLPRSTRNFAKPYAQNLNPCWYLIGTSTLALTTGGTDGTCHMKPASSPELVVKRVLSRMACITSLVRVLVSVARTTHAPSRSTQGFVCPAVGWDVCWHRHWCRGPVRHENARGAAGLQIMFQAAIGRAR